MSSTLRAPSPNTPPLGETPTTKARVLHVINGDDYSGAERVQDLLALRLAEFGYDVGIACTKPGLFATARQAEHVPLYEVPMRSRFDLRPIFQLSRIVRDEGYELVHTHSARSALVGRPASAWAGVPMVHHLHCQTSTEVSRRWLSWINASIEYATLYGVPAIVAVSPSLCDYLSRQGIEQARIAYVPNGVPAPDRRRDDTTPQGTWTLGTVAMFRPRKGIETLLEAVAQLRAAGQKLRLRAIGRFQTTPYEHQVKAYADELGVADAVDWIGFTRDVPAELAQTDLVVLPSLVPEGMPMVVLEAMASGVPVIGSRVEGIVDVITDGEDGLLFTAGDAEHLAAVVDRCITGHTDWSALRQRGLEKHGQQFSDEAMARRIAEMYDELLFAHRCGAL